MSIQNVKKAVNGRHGFVKSKVKIQLLKVKALRMMLNIRIKKERI